MALTRFDDGALGPSLTTYYNITEPGKEPTTTGTDVDVVPSGYDTLSDTAVPYYRGGDWTNRVQYDSGSPAMIGQMKAMTVPASAGLISNHGVRQYPAGLTIVEIIRGSGYRESFGIANGATSMVAHWRGNSDPKNHTLSIGSLQKKFGIPYPENTDTIVVYVQQPYNPTENYSDITLYIRDYSPANLSEVLSAQGRVVESTDYTIGCGARGASASLEGELALFAAYDRALIPSEVTDIQDLCAHWIANGSAPIVDYDSEAKYYCVPNDVAATLTWEVRREGFDWVEHNASTSIGGLSNSTTLSEHGVPHDTLHIVSAITADNCGIRCTASTPYNIGIVTNVGTLNVVEA